MPSDAEATWASPVKSEAITVDENFSMANFYSSSSSKGFSVKSDSMDEVPFSLNYKGYAPYIICVPAVYDTDQNFLWPAECVSIFDAYPQFAAWAEDHNTNTEWYKHRDVEHPEYYVDLDAILSSDAQ